LTGVALLASGLKPHVTSACEDRSNWLALHANELPNTLEEIAGYPEAYRKIIFSGLTPEVKSGLMREQLNQFLASEPLSPEQRKFVTNAITMVTPAKYAKTHQLTADEAEQHQHEHQILSAEARRLFSPSQQRVFIDLGYGITKPMAPRLALPESALAAGGGSDASMFDCQCSSQDPWCGGYICQVIQNCQHTTDGCGFLECYPCDGMCYNAH
jgi:hypothetical protein